MILEVEKGLLQNYYPFSRGTPKTRGSKKDAAIYDAPFELPCGSFQQSGAHSMDSEEYPSYEDPQKDLQCLANVSEGYPSYEDPKNGPPMFAKCLRVVRITSLARLLFHGVRSCRPQCLLPGLRM